MSRGSGIYLAITLFATSAWAEEAGSKALALYSVAPLANPSRDVAANAVELTGFNNWLNENHHSIPEDKRRAHAEHLYSIIDSHVKQLHAREGVLLPTGPDPVLPVCFAWAARLGIYGADAVLAELDPEASTNLKARTAPPGSFRILARSDTLRLESAWGGWTAVMPYWFMIHELLQNEAAEGPPLQIAIISTGFGPHAGGEGFSQATIMLAFSPKANQSEFEKYWIGAYGLSAEHAAADEVGGNEAHRKFDATANMKTELVFPEVETGPLAVAYMGLAGTFEHNRQHFLDFLAALSLP